MLRSVLNFFKDSHLVDSSYKLLYIIFEALIPVVVAIFVQVNMAALRGISLKMVNEIKMKFDPFHPEAATLR